MPKINLRDLYPDFYKTDCIIDIPNEVLAVFVEHERREAAYRRRMYYHKAHYSLDCDDGIESSIQFVALSPDEIYTRKLTTQQLHAAIAALPNKQAKRVYAHYICTTYFQRSRLACTAHTIKHDRLEMAVLYAVRQQVHLSVMYSEVITQINAAPSARANQAVWKVCLRPKKKSLLKSNDTSKHSIKIGKMGRLPTATTAT